MLGIAARLNSWCGFYMCICMLMLLRQIRKRADSAMQGPEFVVEFYKVMPRSLRHSLKHFDEATRGRVNRLIGVWDERKACSFN